MRALINHKTHSIAHTLYLILKAIRVHQWVKNSLLFVPAITSYSLSWSNIEAICMAFVSFCLIASVVYVINDLHDLAADRAHPTKKNRPFASGQLSTYHAIWMIPGFTLLSLQLAKLLGIKFLLLVVSYLLINLAYSFYLKSQPVIDLILLAIMYTARIIGGMFIVHQELKFWLLSFAILVFMSLAALKRYSEIKKQGGLEKVKGRGYFRQDENFLLILGVSSFMSSLLVFLLFINQPEIILLYSSIKVLWILCPIYLFWITRLWHLAYHNVNLEDPILFCIKDLVTIYTAILVVAILIVSKYIDLAQLLADY